MKYCKDVQKLLGIKAVCGQKCPLIDNCPRLILEDALDTGIKKASKALLKIKENEK